MKLELLLIMICLAGPPATAQTTKHSEPKLITQGGEDYSAEAAFNSEIRRKNYKRFGGKITLRSFGGTQFDDAAIFFNDTSKALRSIITSGILYPSIIPQDFVKDMIKVIPATSQGKIAHEGGHRA